MLGITEIIIILVVAAIVLFGGKKIGEIGRSLGRFGTEFQKGKIEAERELKNIKDEFGKAKEDKEDKEEKEDK